MVPLFNQPRLSIYWSILVDTTMQLVKYFTSEFIRNSPINLLKYTGWYNKIMACNQLYISVFIRKRDTGHNSYWRATNASHSLKNRRLILISVDAQIEILFKHLQLLNSSLMYLLIIMIFHILGETWQLKKSKYIRNISKPVAN